MFVVVALSGCAATSPLGPASSSASAGHAVAALATERQWLQSWFKGTPVRIEQRSDGSVSIDVPREFCFDTGQSHVKPPLLAVLDKVAESLRRAPQVRLPLISAPGDAAAPAAPLALRRATQIRTHLVDRGVPAAQLGNPEATTADAVQLRMEPAPP